MIEGYEPLKEYDDLYLINKDGCIWSLVKNKVMKSKNKTYQEIALRKNGKYYYTTIHRLLGIQFIPNPDNLPEIDHIDRNGLNNCLTNLRWVSREDNNKNKTNYIGKEKWKEHKKEYDKQYRLKNKERILKREALSHFN
jgi:hypothetical protein